MNNKACINGKIYDITTCEEYEKNSSLYDPRLTVIERDGILYPIKSDNNDDFGYIASDSPLHYFKLPTTQEDQTTYAVENNEIIKFQDINSMTDYIEKQSEYKNLERTILTSPDNIFMPVVTSNDEPTMRALKEAVLAKNIDLDKYSSRFGANYCNDKRLFKGTKITLSKLKDIAENLDMNCTLIIEDKSEDVPNPIGKKIVVNITDYKNNQEEGE